MKRVDLLKKELGIINNLQCLAFNVKEDAQKYYEHEIQAIEKYGSANPEYGERKFYNIDLKENTDDKN